MSRKRIAETAALFSKKGNVRPAIFAHLEGEVSSQWINSFECKDTGVQVVLSSVESPFSPITGGEVVVAKGTKDVKISKKELEETQVIARLAGNIVLRALPEFAASLDGETIHSPITGEKVKIDLAELESDSDEDEDEDEDDDASIEADADFDDEDDDLDIDDLDMEEDSEFEFSDDDEEDEDEDEEDDDDSDDEDDEGDEEDEIDDDAEDEDDDEDDSDDEEDEIDDDADDENSDEDDEDDEEDEIDDDADKGDDEDDDEDDKDEEDEIDDDADDEDEEDEDEDEEEDSFDIEDFEDDADDENSDDLEDEDAVIEHVVADSADLTKAEVAQVNGAFWLISGQTPIARVNPEMCSELPARMLQTKPDNFSTALVAAVKSSGLSEDVVEKFGLELLRSEVLVSSVVAKHISKEVAKQAKVETDKVGVKLQNYSQAVAVAMAGVNKGTFADVDHALKKVFVRKLITAGVRNPARLVDSAFEEASEEWLRTVLAQASALNEEGLEYIKSMARLVSSTAAVKTEDNTDEDEEESDSLASFKNPAKPSFSKREVEQSSTAEAPGNFSAIRKHFAGRK